MAPVNNTSFTYYCHQATKPDWYGFIVSGLIPLGFLIFGIAGMCYSKQRLKLHKSRLVTYLIFLYSWDALLLISTFGFYGFASVFTSPIGAKPLVTPYTYLYLIFYPLVNLSMAGSMWTIIVISIERFIALSQPLRHHSRDNNRFSLIVRGVVLFGSIFITIPRIMELSTVTCWDGAQFKAQVAPSSLRLDPDYQLYYRVLLNTILVCPTPFFIISAVTIKTWLIRREVLRSQERRQINHCHVRRDKTTLLLMVMIGKFLLCQTCPTILNIAELSRIDVRRTRWFAYLIDVSNLLVVFNCATNWLVFSYLPNPKARRPHTMLSHKNSSIIVAEKLETIQNVWPKGKHEQLGIELLLAGMNANPHLREKLAQIYCVETFDESSHAHHVSHHGQNIGGILDRMFSLALSGQSFDRARYEIAHAARAHANHGVVLRNADWIVVKKYLLERLFQKLDEDQKQLGNQLVSMVVSELKNGFAYLPNSPGKLAVLKTTSDGLEDYNSPALRKAKSLCVVENGGPIRQRHATFSQKNEQKPLIKQWSVCV